MFLQELKARCAGDPGVRLAEEPPQHRPAQEDIGKPVAKGSLPRVCGYDVAVGRLAPLLWGFVQSHLANSLLALNLGFLGLAASGRCWWAAIPGLDQVATTTTSAWLTSLLSLALLVAVFTGYVPKLLPFGSVRTPAGVICNEAGKSSARNRRLRDALLAWQSSYFPSPLCRSADTCTALPFLMNPKSGKHLTYERVWLKSSDGEHFALDWVFPRDGFNPSHPVVLLLPGLAPTIHWSKMGGFISDAAVHLLAQGMTVAVHVARGTQDTPVKQHGFHGARTSDLRDAVCLTRGVLDAIGKKMGTPTSTPLFAAGFSMGGIILANYCGQYKDDTLLRGAIALSAAYDCVFNMQFKYSLNVWQPYLIHPLKNMFLRGPMAEEARRRGVNVEKALNSSNLTEFDSVVASVFNGYSGVEDYYGDMSLATGEKWQQVKIPLLAVHARDDPIIHCDALRAEEFAAGNSNLLFLITDRGGHCGWPWGWRFPMRRWQFMSGAITVFIEALLSADEAM